MVVCVGIMPTELVCLCKVRNFREVAVAALWAQTCNFDFVGTCFTSRSVIVFVRTREPTIDSSAMLHSQGQSVHEEACVLFSHPFYLLHVLQMYCLYHELILHWSHVIKASAGACLSSLFTPIALPGNKLQAAISY